MQGFHKVNHDRLEFANEGFLRGQKHLLKTILRRRPTQSSHVVSQQGNGNSASQACVEVGKFGLKEEIERLKRDRSVLMQELVKLRLQQQNTEKEVHRVRDRIQLIEQQQQQMLSFLALAVQSSPILSQLIHQSGNGWLRFDANKRRRLPAPEEVPYSPVTSAGGQFSVDQKSDIEPLFTMGQLSDGIEDLNLVKDVTSSETGLTKTRESDFHEASSANPVGIDQKSELDAFLNMDQTPLDVLPLDVKFPMGILEDVDFDWSQLMDGPANEDDVGDVDFSDIGMDFELPDGEVKLAEVASVLPEEGTEVGNMSLTSMEKSVS